MRVLVLSEAVGGMGPGQTGAAVARGWAPYGHQLAVVPMAAAGGGLAAAVADLRGDDGGIVVVSGGPDAAAQLRGSGLQGDEVWVDLTGWSADGGVSLLGALADAPVEAEPEPGLVAAARARLGGRRLVGVVPAGEVSAELTGLRGVASRSAAAARDAGQPVPPIADLLARDSQFAALAESLGMPSPPPGAGAAAGAGLAVLAVGGEVVSGPGALSAAASLGRTVERADLVVVVADALDFGDAGGEVVLAATAWAEAAGLPCLAFCGVVRISLRELRTLGIEAAYGLGTLTPTEAELTGLARRVAAGWGAGNQTAGVGVEAS